MKAAVYTANDRIEVRNEPQPLVGEGEVLIKVQASGICGSDMHAFHGLDERRLPPLILGHEFAGTIVGGQEEGTAVIVNPMRVCGNCHYCQSGRANLCPQRDMLGMVRAGAMAEYVSVHESGIVRIDREADFVAAALTEPAATAVHAVAQVERFAYRPVSEHRSLVIGGGAIGVLVALVLRNKGCAVVHISETNALRRQTAEGLDGIGVINPISTPPVSNTYDSVYDCVGAGSTRAVACDAVQPGGIISHVGLQGRGDGFDSRKITLQEITLLGQYCYTPSDFIEAYRLIKNNLLGELNWVETRPLNAAAQAFNDIHQGTTKAAKIILIP